MSTARAAALRTAASRGAAVAMPRLTLLERLRAGHTLAGKHLRGVDAQDVRHLSDGVLRRDVLAVSLTHADALVTPARPRGLATAEVTVDQSVLLQLLTALEAAITSGGMEEVVLVRAAVRVCAAALLLPDMRILRREDSAGSPLSADDVLACLDTALQVCRYCDDLLERLESRPAAAHVHAIVRTTLAMAWASVAFAIHPDTVHSCDVSPSSELAARHRDVTERLGCYECAARIARSLSADARTSLHATLHTTELMRLAGVYWFAWLQSLPALQMPATAHAGQHSACPRCCVAPVHVRVPPDLVAPAVRPPSASTAKPLPAMSSPAAVPHTASALSLSLLPPTRDPPVSSCVAPAPSSHLQVSVGDTDAVAVSQVPSSTGVLLSLSLSPCTMSPCPDLSSQHVRRAAVPLVSSMFAPADRHDTHVSDITSPRSESLPVRQLDFQYTQVDAEDAVEDARGYTRVGQLNVDPEPVPVPPDERTLGNRDGEVAVCASQLRTRTIPELKAMLRRNMLKVTGTKTELVQRAADAIVYGCIPRCPVCKKGFLRFAGKDAPPYARYVCPGTFDLEMCTKEECGFYAARVKMWPWRWV